VSCDYAEDNTDIANVVRFLKQSTVSSV